MHMDFGLIFFGASTMIAVHSIFASSMTPSSTILPSFIFNYNRILGSAQHEAGSKGQKLLDISSIQDLGTLLEPKCPMLFDSNLVILSTNLSRNP